MYNFIAFITDRESVHIVGRKHAYRENFANAVTICRKFFRWLVDAGDVEPLLKRHKPSGIRFFTRTMSALLACLFAG